LLQLSDVGLHRHICGRTLQAGCENTIEQLSMQPLLMASHMHRTSLLQFAEVLYFSWQRVLQ
jgi:hypothetical protein